MRSSKLLPFLVSGVIALMSSSLHSYACSVAPTAEQREKSFRFMMESADHVFIGRVSYVLRRRWNDDDTKPNFHKKWLEYAEMARAGEDVGSFGYIVNLVEFAQATAYLSVDTELYYSGLINERRIPGMYDLVPIDLLRPFTVAGHGPCNSFPQTCPWDIEIGETLALAVQRNEFGPYKALICQRTPRLSNDERREIRRNNKFKTKFDAIREAFARR